MSSKLKKLINDFYGVYDTSIIWYKYAKKFKSNKKYDIVISLSYPPTSHLLANYLKNRELAVEPFRLAARSARECGLEINAGHDLNLENLSYFSKNIPWLKEVSIGHALISDALYLGLETTIREYKNCLTKEG